MELKTTQKLDALFKEFDTTHMPGVVVGITQNGETRYQKAFGMANLEYNLALTPDSVLQVGSVSKQFAAVPILLLSEQGKLDLNAPVKKYLDYFPDFDFEITVRHLVHHVSGLRSNCLFLLLNGFSEDDPITQQTLITMAKKQTALNFEPDTFYTYCNLAYVLMAEIVAKVSGKPFREYVDETLLKPLGMTRSFFHDTHFELIPNKAEAYNVSEKGVVNCPIISSNHGSTNFFTTVKDMIKWAQELMDPKVLSPKTVQTAFTPHVCKNGYKTGYGFGFMVHGHQGKKAVDHGGADAGYRAHIYMIPEEKTAVLLLSNRGDFASMRFAKKAMNIALNLPDPSEALQKIPADEDISGTYFIEKWATAFCIEKTGEGTFIPVMGMKKEVLKKEKDTYLVTDFDLEFSLDAKGNMRFISGENTLDGKKVNAVDVPEKEKAYAGKYLGIDYDAVHDVAFTEDGMTLTNNRIGDVQFKRFDNGFYVDLKTNMVAARFEAGKMFLCSQRAMNIEFRKIA